MMREGQAVGEALGITFPLSPENMAKERAAVMSLLTHAQKLGVVKLKP